MPYGELLNSFHSRLVTGGRNALYVFIMSSKAVLAHEYYDHYKNDPPEYNGDWRDEFRASYDAAVNAPNLSDEERKDLMIDAYDRAREAGPPEEYDNNARRIIYGYEVQRSRN